jgi:hypothetical protein
MVWLLLLVYAAAGLIIWGTVGYSRGRRRCQDDTDITGLFPEDSERVRAACALAKSSCGTAMLSTAYEGGWAYYLVRAVPGDDIVVLTGWRSSRRQVHRLMNSAVHQADEDFRARAPGEP